MLTREKVPILFKARLNSLANLPGLTSWLDASYNVYSGGARQFYAADKTSLEIADNAALSTGDIDFTVGAWVYLDNISGSNKTIMGKIGAGLEYWLLFDIATTKFRFDVRDAGGTTTTSISSDIFGVDTSGKWYFVVAWHDAAGDILGISVNGISTTVSYSLGVLDSTEIFSIGARSAGTGSYFDGRISRAFLTKKVLSATERTWLYNLGNGRLYSELGVAGTDGAALLTNMSGYWNLNEPGGTDNALDAHSTNDLTPTFGELLSNTGFETAGTNGGTVYNAPTATRSRTSNVATLVTSINHGLTTGNVATIASMTDTSYNATNVTVTRVDDTTFTYASTGSDEGATADTAGRVRTDVFANWMESVDGNSRIVNDTTTVDAGTHSCRFDIDSSDNGAYIAQTVLTAGHLYTVAFRGKASSGTPQLRAVSTNTSPYVLTTSWASYANTLTAGLTTMTLRHWSGGTSASIYLDAVSCKAINIPAADGPASDVASDSIGSAHGTLTNFASSATAWKADVPTPLSGNLDTSLEFDGTNDRIDITALPLTTTHTVSCWAKSALSDEIVFGSTTTGGFALLSSGGNISYTAVAAGAVSVAYTPSSSAWTHYAIVRSGTSVSFYVNGAQVGTTQTLGSNAVWSLTTLGSVSNATTYAVTGKLSDLRVYVGTALDASQVSELYAGTEATGATPTARWKLDDGPQSGIGTGDPVVDWRTYGGSTQYQFLQSSASKRPLYDADAFGTGVPGIDGDGTDDILVCPTAFLSGTEGTVIAAYMLDAVPSAYQVAIGSSDEAGITKHLLLYGRGPSGSTNIGYDQRNADTDDLLKGSTTVAVSTKYIAVWRSNGTTISMRLNGVNQTVSVVTGANNGDWWGDSADKDNVTVFGFKLSIEGSWLNGKINKIVTSSVCLTDAECAEAERLIAAEIGVTL